MSNQTTQELIEGGFVNVVCTACGTLYHIGNGEPNQCPSCGFVDNMTAEREVERSG